MLPQLVVWGFSFGLPRMDLAVMQRQSSVVVVEITGFSSSDAVGLAPFVSSERW